VIAEDRERLRSQGARRAVEDGRGQLAGPGNAARQVRVGLDQGYDALRQVDGLFVSPSGLATLVSLHDSLTDGATFEDVAHTAKRDVTKHLLQAEVQRLIEVVAAIGIEDIEDINIVAAPGQTDPVIQDAVLSHCENMRYRFAILDSPEVIEKGGVDKIPKPRDSKYGSYYFPWLSVYDPIKGNIFQPPSGYMAGVYARSDGERGVHKAPANEVVRGALGLRYAITKGEQDLLNPKGINCIRAFPNRGIRVWGARTISSDASWRYINVRRLFNMVEQSIEIGTQWVKAAAGSKYKYDYVITENATDPNVPVGAKLLPFA